MDKLLKNAGSEAGNYALQETIIKRDLRDIKLGNSATITIDIEELKRVLEENHYPPTVKSLLQPLA